MAERGVEGLGKARRSCWVWTVIGTDGGSRISEGCGEVSYPTESGLGDERRLLESADEWLVRR